jgi:RNA polymerase sigma factor (sigma-70 family)
MRRGTSESGSDEALLVRLIEEPNDEAWREFFERYSRFIHEMARQRGLGWSDADDIVQETLTAVARKVLAAEPPRGVLLKTHIYGVAHNKIADFFREREKETRLNGCAVEWQSRGDNASSEAAEFQWQLSVLQLAVTAAEKVSSARDFALFKSSVLEDRGAREAARRAGTSVRAAYNAVDRVKTAIRREAHTFELALY